MCDSFLGEGGGRGYFWYFALSMSRNIIPYNPKLKQLARKLRKDMTFGEVLLWNVLKGDKLWGFDFDRQRCIDNYIVDFYCKDLMLAIEVDGSYHNWEETFAKDEERQDRIESFRIEIVRFSEVEMKSDMINVVRTIKAKIIEIIKKKPDIKLPSGFDKSVLEDCP